MKETYLSWYKDRMSKILNPDYYSLMSSSVCEPWDLLESHRAMMSKDEFNERFQNSNAYGLPALIHRICDRYGVPERNLLTTQGVTSAIFLLSTGLLEKNDRVLVETPGYQPLWQSPMHCGARIDTFKRWTDRPIQQDMIRDLIHHQTRLIIITDLHNPTGYKITDEEILSIVEIMKEKAPNAYLIVDEIYRDFIPGRQLPAAMLDDRIISTSSLTKVYGFSVLRCGWIVAAPDVIENLRKVQILMSGIGSRYLETLSTIVFDHLEEYRIKTQQIVTKNRQILREEIGSMIQIVEGTVPEWGCVYFPRIKDIPDTRLLTDYLETVCGVLCVPGTFFGAADHIRIGFGEIAPDRLLPALGRFKKGIRSFLNDNRHMDL
ncbi:pyridoxal phosphate-dependent aminotransferase [bacterium]|nr:pyridoxal phosphate-dependent aminotransferase [candidate division CSSED10-310 bacterium]